MPADVISVGPPAQKTIPPTLVSPAPKASTMTVVLPLIRENKSKLFSEALLELSSVRQPRRTADLVFSILLHTLILAALVLTPLYFTDTIDIKGLTLTVLVALPPPPPPPPAAQAIARIMPAPRRTFVSGGKLIAPRFIPQNVAILKEVPLPPDVGVGGVPGGVPGGQLGGVIGGIISDASRTNVPLPTAAVQPRAPIRVGGRIRPPRLISRATPAYPALAKQTRVEGAVTIDAVIDTEGNVVEMRVVSGHPLLISAALNAVRQWKYEPTYLNDQPIAVQLMVTVTFQLGQ